MVRTILIVDDSPSVRRQVRLALAPLGHTMLEAGDGVEGIDRLEQNEISLVLCDLNMPRMGGIEMVEKVRGTPAYAHVAVLMLTSEGQPALIHRAKQAGVKGWIVKPFRAELLASAVQSILRAQPTGPAAHV